MSLDPGFINQDRVCDRVRILSISSPGPGQDVIIESNVLHPRSGSRNGPRRSEWKEVFENMKLSTAQDIRKRKIIGLDCMCRQVGPLVYVAFCTHLTFKACRVFVELQVAIMQLRSFIMIVTHSGARVE